MTNITNQMPKETKFNVEPIKASLKQIKIAYKNKLVTDAIAKELGFSERTFYRHLKNIETMPIEKFFKLIIILQVSPDEVLNTEKYNPSIKDIIDNYLLSLD